MSRGSAGSTATLDTGVAAVVWGTGTHGAATMFGIGMAVAGAVSAALKAPLVDDARSRRGVAQAGFMVEHALACRSTLGGTVAAVQRRRWPGRTVACAIWAAEQGPQNHGAPKF